MWTWVLLCGQLNCPRTDRLISGMNLWIALDVIFQGLIYLYFFYCIDSKFLVNANIWSIFVMCLPFDALSYKHDVIFSEPTAKFLRRLDTLSYWELENEKWNCEHVNPDKRQQLWGAKLNNGERTLEKVSSAVDKAAFILQSRALTEGNWVAVLCDSSSSLIYGWVGQVNGMRLLKMILKMPMFCAWAQYSLVEDDWWCEDCTKRRCRLFDHSNEIHGVSVYVYTPCVVNVLADAGK